MVSIQAPFGPGTNQRIFSRPIGLELYKSPSEFASGYPHYREV